MRVPIQRTLRKLLFPISKVWAMGSREARRAHLAHEQMLSHLLWLQYRNMLHSHLPLPSLHEVGFSVYSQMDEDGILLYLLALIGSETQRIVDLGAVGPNGSNSVNLILNHGWHGLLIDGDIEAIDQLNTFFAVNPSARSLAKIIHTWITADNINDLLAANDFIGTIDVLTMDLDGNDYWIWKCLEIVQPRIVLVEYQNTIGPDLALTIPYRPHFRVADYEVNHLDYNYAGASLAAFVKLGKQKGYRLVGRNRGGFNAFFVRESIAQGILPEVTAEACLAGFWDTPAFKARYESVRDMDWVEL